MSQFTALVRVELTEAAKEYKYVWLTIFFVLLGLTQPLINLYMDLILQQMGGSIGVILDPDKSAPTANEVFLSTISGQFNQIGLIILLISFMGLIATDRQNGMQDFILTRPVSIHCYVSAKLIAHWFISMFSLGFGILTSYGCTVYLFGAFPMTKLISFSVLYSLWILYLISLVIVISMYVRHQVLIAISAIGISFLLLVLKNLDPVFSDGFPSSILNVAEHQLVRSSVVSYRSIFSCLLFTFLNLMWASKKLKN